MDEGAIAKPNSWTKLFRFANSNLSPAGNGHLLEMGEVADTVKEPIV